MGIFIKVTLVIVPVLIAYSVYQLHTVPPMPKLETTWWGPGLPQKEDTVIKPFKINVSNKTLADLKYRLANARSLIPPLEGIQQQYGLNTKLLAKVIDHWRTQYDWREREKFLNQYPQFTVKIQGLRLHYLHVKPTNPEGLKVLPLLLLHGWPGSVREFYEMIPLLTTPREGQKFVFELIVPSLPGYGFSEAAVRPGLGLIQMAVLFNNFMQRLGFEKYFLQGGDFGAGIAQNIATIYPDRVLGVHSNMCIVNSPLANLKLFVGSLYPPMIVSKELEDKVYPLSTFFSFILLETGYAHLQATKPDTLGVAMNDSPVGLAAYMLEKFISWTNPDWKNLEDGGLLKKFTYTQLLDDIMIYWVSGSITTSFRLYAESINTEHLTSNIIGRIPVTVPSACVQFAYEIHHQPLAILKEKYPNLVHYQYYADGGHFAALEEPKVLANDIYKAIAKMI